MKYFPSISFNDAIKIEYGTLFYFNGLYSKGILQSQTFSISSIPIEICL